MPLFGDHIARRCRHVVAKRQPPPLGQGPVPQAIVTDDRGTGRASLWRDLSSLPTDTAFDVHFRVIPIGTSTVVLESDCYRFLVRD